MNHTFIILYYFSFLKPNNSLSDGSYLIWGSIPEIRSEIREGWKVEIGVGQCQWLSEHCSLQAGRNGFGRSKKPIPLNCNKCGSSPSSPIRLRLLRICVLREGLMV